MAESGYWTCSGCQCYVAGPQCWNCFALRPEPDAIPELVPPPGAPAIAIMDRARCHVCKQPSLVRVGPVEEWSTDPPPIDAALYRLWRCETEGCGVEIAGEFRPTEAKR